MKKKFIIAILFMFIVLPINNVDALGGNLDGGGQTAGTCADKCSWVYDSPYKGLRLSLYKYDGTGDPTFVKSIELLNNPSLLNGKTLKTTAAHGRFGHPGATFTSQNVGQRFKSFSTYGMTNIDSSNPDWQNIKEAELKAYYGDTQAKRKDALYAMFGVTTNELPKYYIVLEPTISIQNQCGYGWAFGTGYEYMENLNTLNSGWNCAGWNFGQSQGSTVRKYLFNGMYVALTEDGEYDTYNFVGESGSGAYVIATSAAADNSYIENNYHKKSFPYGMGIFWMMDGIKTCQSFCSGKTGDNLLSCAENYCAQDENVTNSTQKRECIINDCKYPEPSFTCSSSSTTNGSATVCSDKTNAKKSTCEFKTLNGLRYKITCETGSKVTYPDILPKTIIPGEGFEYQVKLSGYKNCTVELDKGQLKLDYASSYTSAERQNLETAVSNYNNKSFSLPFYSKNGTIKINIKEKKTNTATLGSTTKTLVAKDEYNLGSEKVSQTNTTSTIKSFYTSGENSVEKQFTIKTFKTESSNEVLYDLPKVCISAEDNITIEEGSSCDNGLGPYAKYFTTIHAEKAKNDTKTDATHSASGLDVDNTCYYEVTPDELSCHISFKYGDASSPEDNQCGNNYFYASGDVEFTLTYNYNYNRNDKSISYNIGTTKITTTNASSYNGKDTYKIGKSTITSPTEVTVYGTVTDGKNIKHCSQTVTIYPNIDKCEFIKTENPANNTVTISIKDIGQSGAIYQTRQSTNDSTLGWMNLKSRTIGKEDHIILEGRILVNGAVIKNCFYEYPPTTICPECTATYLPSQYKEIKEHCASYWQIDKAGYTSYDNCVDHCSKGRLKCPPTCDDYEGEAKVTCARNYCNEFYVEDGYVKIGDCINDCVDKNEGLNYYYRTINNDDPFPQREAHYNWIGYEEYITDDDDDSTPSRGGSHPEYEIKLDKERMAKINQNTYNYNSGSGNTAYSDYIRVNSTDTGKYKSKFIHVDDPNEGGFKTYFTYIEGSKVGG